MSRLLPALVALTLGAVPASAIAETRYVAKGGADSPGCSNSGSPCSSIVYAVGQANDGDTIQIGPGTFVESVETSKVLAFTGAGAGTLGGIPATTVVRGPVEGFGYSPLVLPNGGSVSSMRAEGGKGQDDLAGSGDPGGDALVFESTPAGDATLRLDHVVLVGGDGGAGKPSDPFETGAAGDGLEVRSGVGAVALSAADSEFAGGAGFGNGDGVDVRGPNATANIVNSRAKTEGSTVGTGIVGSGGARLTLDSVEIDADRNGATIYEGSMTVRRSTVLGTYALVTVASGGTTSSAEVIDSLLISTGGTAAESYAYDEGSTASLSLVGSTIFGLNSAAAVRAIREEGSGSANVTMRNSIARHLPDPKTPPADLLADGGTIDADFSSFTTRIEVNGGSATAPGSAANVAGDPLFVDPNRGNFALQGSSPLIDRGNPALVGSGELDLGGSPRSLDGNHDCIAAPDIGAFEVTGQGVACDSPPTISKFGITNKVFAPKGGKKKSQASKAVERGTKFTYTLSEPAKVTIVIERKKKRKKKKASFTKVTKLGAQEESGKQSTPFSGRVKGKSLKPGKYRATITATDSAGQASVPRQLSFQIVAG